MTIEWIETEVPLKSLKEYDRNPRRISKDSFAKLVKSLKEDGYHQRVVINQDGTIIGGHQRKKAFKEAGYKPTDKIKVLKPNRLLQEDEFKRINVRDNAIYGEWDIDMLAADFDLPELAEWGIEVSGLFVSEKNNEATEDEDKIFKKNNIKCPKCGHEFE